MSDSSCISLPPYCAVAFKEWAVVCAALAAGRQSIILRKGGIHEGREGFRVQHSTFWLYPTNFHQQSQHLSDDAGDFLTAAARQQPPPGEFHLSQLAIVEQVIRLEHEEVVQSLRGLHIWSDATVRERFQYRQPGLFLLLVRIFAHDTPHVVQETPEMAGCKSWVDLSHPMPTTELKPVLSETEFTARKSAVLAALDRNRT